MNAHRFPGVVAARSDGWILADNAGGAQVPGECIESMQRFLERENAQKGSPFARKEHVTELVANAREAVAELLGVRSDTIGFGANATSISFALARTIAHAVRPGDRVVVSDSDHYANIAPWSWLARFGAEIVHVPVDAQGLPDEDAFAAAVAQEPVLVALPWALNATGAVVDVRRLSALAKRHGALVVVDAVQAAPHLRIDVPESIDVLFFSGYKVYGPHLGAFYAHPEFARRFFTADDPLIPSAPLHWSMETGTQNHEGLAGWLGTAAYLRELGNGSLRDGLDAIALHERELTAYALRAFEERAEHVVLYGPAPGRERLPVFAFNLRAVDPETVGSALNAVRIEASVGNYYAVRLMRALAPETGGVAVRLSFAHYNDTGEVDRCMAALDAIAGSVADETRQRVSP